MNSRNIAAVDNSQQNPMGVLGPDARRMRKAIFRRTIDYNASIMNYLKDRIYYSSHTRRVLQPDYLYNYLMNPPSEYLESPMNCVTGKLVRTSTNKNKCPIYCVCWTPEGRRLITGAYSGEFTLWNGLTFNFETILQAHETQIRCMKWSHNDEWLLTADHAGYVKYWQANMNNVEMYPAHKEPIRGVSFSPFDSKFVTCSDDSTVRIWDFFRCTEERVLRGHGSDVRSVAWHPYKSLIISGSKDAQQPIKLWEPKTGESIATLYVHKNTCTDVAWNRNGNWFLTASRDHLIKLFDLRHMKNELQTFRGHKRDVMRVVWHPCHEGLFASGSADGAIHFWCAGTETELGCIDSAHESMIWSLAWHPLGHILVSGANDFATKFWTRNRPGDILRDIMGGGAGQAGGANSLGVDDLTTVPDLEDNLAEDADKMPIFDSIITTTCPADEQALVENAEEPLVEIPGLNDGHPGPLFPGGEHLSMDGEDDDGDNDKDRNRLLPPRPGGSISKEFMANWSSSRVASKTSVVLSAVAAASAPKDGANHDDDEFGIGDMVQGDSDTNEGNPVLIRNVSTPLVTSDMCMNPKAKAAANEAAEYDARHKTGRKFDTAAREEDMLAFANRLMPSSPPAPLQDAPTAPPQSRTSQPPPPPEMDQSVRPPPNMPSNQPMPPQRFAGPPPRYMGMRFPPGGGGGGGGLHLPPYPPYWRQPLPPPGGQFGGPPHDQWGPPPPHYNGPHPHPPPHGYGPGGGPPPPKRPALHPPPPPPHHHIRQPNRRRW